MKPEIKVIDIENEFRNSNSWFLKSLPGFVIKGIETFIRQDEMNDVINLNNDKTGVPFINGVLKSWNISTEIHGKENIPSSGRFVFVGNHPVGAIDALAFLSMIHKSFPEVVSPSNEILARIPNLRPLMLGINVFGKNTRETAEKINDLFESGVQVMMFPSGEVSRRTKGVIADPVWQKSFISKAIRYKRDIIPVHHKRQKFRSFLQYR